MPPAKDPERAETEARMQEAIAEYEKTKKKDPQDRKSSVRRVAKDFNIPHKTLEGPQRSSSAQPSPRSTNEPHNSRRKGVSSLDYNTYTTWLCSSV